MHHFIKDWGALAAAAIIAIATVWGINLTQRGEDRRAEKRVEQQARGAARALIYELRDSAAYMDYLLNGLGHWEPLDERFPIRLPQEDMELIEARLDGVQYEAVSRALAGVASTEDRVRQLGPGTAPEPVRWRRRLPPARLLHRVGGRPTRTCRCRRPGPPTRQDGAVLQAAEEVPAPLVGPAAAAEQVARSNACLQPAEQRPQAAASNGRARPPSESGESVPIEA